MKPIFHCHLGKMTIEYGMTDSAVTRFCDKNLVSLKYMDRVWPLEAQDHGTFSGALLKVRQIGRLKFLIK